MPAPLRSARRRRAERRWPTCRTAPERAAGAHRARRPVRPVWVPVSRRPGRRRPAGHVAAPANRAGARSEAVVPIVRLDHREGVLRKRVQPAKLERAFEGAQMQGCLAQRNRPLEPVEGLQVLERVALDAGAHRLADDGVKIHEQLGPQHAVEFVLARGVAAHQALQRGGLVRCEVIDVEIRKARPPFRNQVDEGFEGRLLLGGSTGPAAVIQRVTGGRRHPSEQVFEPAGAGEGIAFEVQEDVARRRRRQSAETAAFRHRQQFMDGRAEAPALELHAGLLANPLVGLGRSP